MCQGLDRYVDIEPCHTGLWQRCVDTTFVTIANLNTFCGLSFLCSYHILTEDDREKGAGNIEIIGLFKCEKAEQPSKQEIISCSALVASQKIHAGHFMHDMKVWLRLRFPCLAFLSLVFFQRPDESSSCGI